MTKPFLACKWKDNFVFFFSPVHLSRKDGRVKNGRVKRLATIQFLLFLGTLHIVFLFFF